MNPSLRYCWIIVILGHFRLSTETSSAQLSARYSNFQPGSSFVRFSVVPVFCPAEISTVELSGDGAPVTHHLPLRTPLSEALLSYPKHNITFHIWARAYIYEKRDFLIGQVGWKQPIGHTKCEKVAFSKLILPILSVVMINRWRYYIPEPFVTIFILFRPNYLWKNSSNGKPLTYTLRNAESTTRCCPQTSTSLTLGSTLRKENFLNVSRHFL